MKDIKPLAKIQSPIMTVDAEPIREPSIINKGIQPPMIVAENKVDSNVPTIDPNLLAKYRAGKKRGPKFTLPKKKRKKNTNRR
jgi:hypothetical protein